MSKRHYIIITISILVGAFVGSELFPIAPIWKIIVLILSPLLVVFLIHFLNSKRFVASTNTAPDHMSILYRLLEKLGSNDFDRDDPDYKLLQKSSPTLANQLLKVDGVYQANRQFTQNAAHELQTPLTVIKVHAESLLQTPNLSENQAESIGAILHNINKLSRLNSALVLLSKIEHGHFPDEETVDFCDVIDATLELFDDMIEVKGLQIERQFSNPFIVNMSVSLAEILIANLIQNAVRHNLEGGQIKIETSGKELVISNTGALLTAQPKQLFNQFYRESDAEEGLGLGLSIVKRIVDQSGLLAIYQYEEGFHAMKISFYDEMT